MDNIVDRTTALIADRIHSERTQRGWSQADLAIHSGVSRPMISKIERHEVSPSAVLLASIAQAFGLTLAALIVRAESGMSRHVRADDQQIWKDPATGYVRKQIFQRPDHSVEVVEVVLPGGQRVDFPAAVYANIRQVVWVQDGTLVITEGQMRHELATGDSLGFGTPSDVTISNEGQNACRYVVTLARS